MHSSGRFTCLVEQRGSAVHVIAAGDLDYRTREAFDSAVRDVLAACPGTVVLDLSAMQFLSSEGVSALISANNRAAETGTTLVITPSPFLRRRLNMFGLTGILTLTPDTDANTPAT
jgi:anti-anti-sigma factor